TEVVRAPPGAVDWIERLDQHDQAELACVDAIDKALFGGRVASADAQQHERIEHDWTLAQGDGHVRVFGENGSVAAGQASERLRLVPGRDRAAEYAESCLRVRRHRLDERAHIQPYQQTREHGHHGAQCVLGAQPAGQLPDYEHGQYDRVDQ